MEEAFVERVLLILNGETTLQQKANQLEELKKNAQGSEEKDVAYMVLEALSPYALPVAPNTKEAEDKKDQELKLEELKKIPQSVMDCMNRIQEGSTCTYFNAVFGEMKMVESNSGKDADAVLRAYKSLLETQPCCTTFLMKHKKAVRLFWKNANLISKNTPNCLKYQLIINHNHIRNAL